MTTRRRFIFASAALAARAAWGDSLRYTADDGREWDVPLTLDLRHLAHLPEPVPATQPAAEPPPVNNPIPSGATLVRKGQSGVAKVAPGQTVLYERGGVWDLAAPIRATGDRVTLGAFGTGPAPLLRCKLGALAATAEMTRLSIFGLSLFCTGKATNPGPSLIGLDLRLGGEDWKFVDVTATGFEWGCAVQSRRYEKAPRSEWVRNVAMERCRFLDARSPRSFGGQGIYIANVDGLELTGCTLAGNGWDGKGKASIFCHGAYLSTWTAGVVVKDCTFAANGSYGLQARTGADVSACLFADNAIAALFNGPSSSLSSSAVLAGHFQHPPREGGGQEPVGSQSGVDWHVGGGPVRDNLWIGGPPVPPKFYSGPTLSATPRAKRQGWEWDKPASADTAGNVAAGWKGLPLVAGKVTKLVVVKALPAVMGLPPGWLERAKAGTGTAAEGIALLKAQVR